MKRKHLIPRLIAAALSLALAMSPCASALTPAQCLELLEKYYIDDLPPAVYEQTTISGMLRALGDPYTNYLTHDQYDRFNDSMSDDRLVGIGITFSAQADGLHVGEVLSGGPAEGAGMKAGDIIIAVDGHSAKGITSDQATGWIQGQEGTAVVITYLRGTERTTVSMDRAVVVIPSTTFDLIDGHIGYITCPSFGLETTGHFRDILTAHDGEVTCWIIDLQDNFGGYTVPATDSAQLFTQPRGMAYFRDGEGNYSVFQPEVENATIRPVIVLMNDESASSAEIFAAAIQGSESGIIIGERSYGKGTAQTVLDKERFPDYFPDGDAMKVTSYRYFSLLGNTADQVGVMPDIMASPQVAPSLACLLNSAALGPQTERTLRIDLGYNHPWRWYVDLDIAEMPENRSLFEYLLHVLPPDTPMWTRDFPLKEWQPVTAKELGKSYGFVILDNSFPDLDSSFSPEALAYLRYYGLINGKDDGAYHPQDTLTRAELCQLLAEALACSVPNNQAPFDDVSPDAWYAPAVTAISNLGLVNGTGDGSFRPEDPVDHQQFITIMSRLSRWLNMFMEIDDRRMTDEDLADPGLMAYPDWAKPWVWLLGRSQTNAFGEPVALLWADVTEIDPTSPTTRDEAAFTLYSIFTYLGVLPS